jgi:endo-1,4-beta-xylanase
MRLTVNIKNHIITLLVLLVFTPRALPAQQKKEDNKGLKDYYKSYFPIGVAVAPRHLEDPVQRTFILKHFNSLTAENAMKMGPIHPEESRYNWAGADAIVAFAQENGLKVRGHNLCWHTQAPKWMFINEDGSQVTKEILLKRLKDHIYARSRAL